MERPKMNPIPSGIGTRDGISSNTFCLIHTPLPVLSWDCSLAERIYPEGMHKSDPTSVLRWGKPLMTLRPEFGDRRGIIGEEHN